jgi:23S rRNA (uracil1939-C5)-methyltransferase
VNWPAELELDLTGIAQGGAAVGRYEGRVVFAYGGLPGERVRLRLRERQKAFASGHVVEVLHPSPWRVAPPEPSALHADWQFIAYDEQLRLKAQIVVEQLAHLGGLADLPVAPTLPSPRPWQYRNSASLHGDERGALGYYAPGSRRVLDLPADPLLDPRLNAALAALRPSLRAHPQTRLRALTLRANTRGEVLALLAGAGDLAALAQGWRDAFPLAGVVVRRRERTTTLLGSDFLRETIAGRSLRISASSFFQVNTAQAETLVGLALAWLAPEPGMRLLDLYCGVGTFALPLAAAGAQVLGIEEHAGAVADAQASAREQHLPLELRLGTVEALLPTITGPLDAVLLDPPRRGCAPEALAALAALAPRHLLYVSCHPGTLARDLRLLVGHGYRVRRVQPVDMFPQTHHVETAVLIDR